MAQRPTNDFDIDPNITSGTDLANILNRFQDAIDSGNSGASRPAYLAAGGMWVKEGAPMRLYFYDGTKDIELYNTTDGIVAGIPDGTVDGQITTWNAASGEWTPDGAITIDTNGDATFSSKVGIGRSDPDESLVIQGSMKLRGSNAIWFSNTSGFVGLSCYTSANIRLGNDNTNGTVTLATNGGSHLIVDYNGNVGIGMAPLLSTAKEQLADWNAKFDARLKAEPKADKKAVTLEITDGEFDTFPSEKDLEKWLETRGAGDKLQVDGNGSFSGTVNASEVDVTGDGNFTGQVHADEFLRNGVPVPTAKDLIETLSTLREATRDETTLEGLRDALSDAIGGLIQKFEAQISTTES